MPAPRFVHLRLHTEYSIVDGMARVDGAVAAAAADGMPALAITDAGNLFGAVKFYLAARAGGVQPVIGCDLAITNEKNRDQPFRVAVLCRPSSAQRPSENHFAPRAVRGYNQLPASQRRLAGA